MAAQASLQTLERSPGTAVVVAWPGRQLHRLLQGPHGANRCAGIPPRGQHRPQHLQPRVHGPGVADAAVAEAGAEHGHGDPPAQPAGVDHGHWQDGKTKPSRSWAWTWAGVRSLRVRLKPSTGRTLVMVASQVPARRCARASCLLDGAGVLRAKIISALPDVQHDVQTRPAPMIQARQADVALLCRRTRARRLPTMPMPISH